MHKVNYYYGAKVSKYCTVTNEYRPTINIDNKFVNYFLNSYMFFLEFSLIIQVVFK